MRYLIAFLLLTLLAAAAVGPAPARAETAITVISSGARVNFPSGVTFTLEAESAAEISEVVLQVNTPGQRHGAYPRNVRPDFRPGARVTANWTWRRFGTSLPPGTEVTYRWLMTDAAGSVHETPVASVRVDDTRFQWKELREGPVTVRWHEGGDAFGRDLLSATKLAVSRLEQEQGVDLQTPVTVHVYASDSEMHSALPGLPAWAGGISLGEWDMLLVPIPPQQLNAGRRALVHELAHQLIYQITFHPALGSKVPVWLNEGLAVVAEGATSTGNRRLIDDAVDNGTLPTLRSLDRSFSSMPPAQVPLAYAASESVVRYLLAADGPEKMRALLAEFREGRTPDDALRRAYGRGVDETEDRWRDSLGLKARNRGAGGSADQDSASPAPVSEASPEGGRLLILGSGAAMVLTLLGIFAAGVLLLRRLRRA